MTNNNHNKNIENKIWSSFRLSALKVINDVVSLHLINYAYDETRTQINNQIQKRLLNSIFEDYEY